MNKVIIMGRLCADPEFSQTQSGIACCRFRLAVNRPFANKQTGEREADFISCESWRQTAEFISRYFSKGSMIIIEGSLRNNDYTDNSGVKHYGMKVVIEKAEFCGSKSENSSGGNQNASQPQYAAQPSNYQHQSGQSQNSVQSASAHTYRNDVKRPAQLADIGDLGEFEEILSDGDVPF